MAEHYNPVCTIHGPKQREDDGDRFEYRCLKCEKIWENLSKNLRVLRDEYHTTQKDAVIDNMRAAIVGLLELKGVKTKGGNPNETVHRAKKFY